MTTLPTLKFKALVNFPATVTGRNGINVAKIGNVFFVDLDYSKFSTSPTVSPTSYILTYDPGSSNYVLSPPAAGSTPSDNTPLANGVGAPGVSALYSRYDHVHPSDPTRAPINSPVFTGDPQAPTATPGDNDTSVATTAFVQAAVTSSTSIFNITSPTSQQLLQYDSGTSKFINRNQADLHAQSITSGTSVAINRALGEIVSLSLTGTVSTFTVSNWPASGTLGKITIFISNTGAFNITTWPAGTIWPGGVIPTITSGAGKKDLIILTSVDGGTTIIAAIAGQDFH